MMSSSLRTVLVTGHSKPDTWLKPWGILLICIRTQGRDIYRCRQTTSSVPYFACFPHCLLNLYTRSKDGCNRSWLYIPALQACEEEQMCLFQKWGFNSSYTLCHFWCSHEPVSDAATDALLCLVTDTIPVVSKSFSANLHSLRVVSLNGSYLKENEWILNHMFIRARLSKRSTKIWKGKSRKGGRKVKESINIDTFCT